jgi:hypothetical protein
MDALRKAKYNIYRNLTDLMGKSKAPLKESVFLQDGRLTIDEFLLAGDNLTHKCSTWK